MFLDFNEFINVSGSGAVIRLPASSQRDKFRPFRHALRYLSRWIATDRF
jgi:hypothetical protein